MKDFRVLLPGNILDADDRCHESSILYMAGRALEKSGVDESIGQVLLRDVDGNFYTVRTWASIEIITRGEAQEMADDNELEEGIDE